MGPVVVHFELSRKLCGHHLVVHVLLLCRYLPGGDRVEPPAPVIIEDADECEVETLIAYW